MKLSVFYYTLNYILGALFGTSDIFGGLSWCGKTSHSSFYHCRAIKLVCSGKFLLRFSKVFLDIILVTEQRKLIFIIEFMGVLYLITYHQLYYKIIEFYTGRLLS